MKRILLFVVGVTWTMLSFAQSVPISSSAESPLWYYICTTNDKVWTVDDSKVMAQALSSEADDAQLWRFEGDTVNGFRITNKATGTQVCLMYGVKEKNVKLSMIPSDRYPFLCQPYKDGIKFISVNPSLGGDARMVAVCASADGTQIMADTEDKASVYSLKVYIDDTLKYSDETDVFWYRIISCATNLNGYAISDNKGSSQYPLPLLRSTLEDKASQWKLMSGATGTILVNRATGHAIAASSVYDGVCNITQTTVNGDNAGEFVLDYVGNASYTISSTEDDAVVRFLTAASSYGEKTGIPVGDINKSIVGWKFQLVETELTNIKGLVAEPLKIRLVSGRIIVDGVNEWHLYNTQGIELPRTTPLPGGVYIVKANNKAIIVNLKGIAN